MEQKLEQLLKAEAFDIVQLEGLYLTPYITIIRRYSKAAIVFRAHNIEHFIWERMARACKTPGKRQYLRLLASRLKKYETDIIHAVDGLAAITPADEEFFLQQGFRGPTVVIPVGVPELKLPDPLPEADPGSVFHLGSMDWRPNQEGIRWFLQQVWPLVIRQMPGLTFYLAGKRMPSSFRQYASSNVVIVGEVPDALEFTLSKKLLVVPLLSGGGMRVKIIEGMAAARPIVSTPVGAEGIPCIHGEHLYLAEDHAEMARWIIHCFKEPALTEKMARQAMAFAHRHFQTGHIIGNLIKFYQGFGFGKAFK
jgi:polysaccharide biosynthesis protein PslH